MGEGRERRGRHDPRQLIARIVLACCALAAARVVAVEPEVDLTPQYKAPRAGFTADETFIVKLPSKVAMPCVAVDAANARILASRRALEILAKGERPAMTWGDAARALLGAVGGFTSYYLDRGELFFLVDGWVS